MIMDDRFGAVQGGGAGATGGSKPDDATVTRLGRRLSDDELLHAIGRDLASLYTGFLGRPIPKRLAALLSQIESTCQGHSVQH